MHFVAHLSSGILVANELPNSLRGARKTRPPHQRALDGTEVCLFVETVPVVELVLGADWVTVGWSAAGVGVVVVEEDPLGRVVTASAAPSLPGWAPILEADV